MKINLVDRNIEMCDEWNKQFKDCLDVSVCHGDFLDNLSVTLWVLWTED